MISRPLAARVRHPWPALIPLALTAALWAVWVLHPAPAAAGPRTAPWFTGWRPGWLPSDPPSPAAGALPGSGPTFAEPLWSLVSVHSPGLFVALDPVTGLPTMPTAAQRRAAASQIESEDALRAPLSPLVIEHLPGGGEIVHLGGRFQVYSVARRDARGRIVTDCSLDPAAARKLLSAPVPAAPRREEK
jgi:hypothetical protein